MTVETGHFAVLRRSFGAISDDQRVQAVIIAFCFGALLEALAGFGTPVAITAVMLIALGFKPIKAASVALVANTAPVAFGAIATPIITLGRRTELPKDDLGAMVGRQTPFLALIVPLILVYMVDGRRGVRQTWPVALIGGATFAVGQFAVLELLLGRAHRHRGLAARHRLDRRASCACGRPAEPLRRRRRPGASPRPAVAGGSVHDPGHRARDRAARRPRTATPRADVVRAYAPYLIIIAVFSIAQIPAVKDALAESPWTTTFDWPGLDVVTPDGEAVSSITFNFNWLPATGTLMLISGLHHDGRARRLARPERSATFVKTLDQLKWAILTVAAVLGARLRDEPVRPDGDARALGRGRRRRLRLPVRADRLARRGRDRLGHLVQRALRRAPGDRGARTPGISQTLLAAANSSGGVLGKMISPQNLAIGAAAVGMAGQEGDLFRKVLGWSLVLVLHHVRARLPPVHARSSIGWSCSERRRRTRLWRGSAAERRTDPTPWTWARSWPSGGRARRRARDHPRAPAAHLRVGRAAPVRRHARRGGAARLRRGGAGAWWPPATARASPGWRAAPGRACRAGRCRWPTACSSRSRACAACSRWTCRTSAWWSSPGVTNVAVSQAVGPTHFYPPDPSSQIVCTIGGNVAENSGGAHCFKYGFTTNYVTGLELVLPDGTLVAARRQGARPAGARPDRRVRGLRGHARRGHEDLAARGARARGGAHARGVLRLDHRRPARSSRRSCPAGSCRAPSR